MFNKEIPCVCYRINVVGPHDQQSLMAKMRTLGPACMELEELNYRSCWVIMIYGDQGTHLAPPPSESEWGQLSSIAYLSSSVIIKSVSISIKCEVMAVGHLISN